MSVIQKLPPFQNVVASGTAVLPYIPQGMTYEEIILKLGGTTFTKAMITNIRIFLGGKMIWNITGSHLDTINSYFKNTANAAYLSIPFSNRRSMNLAEYLIGALDTSIGYSSFSAEVDIAGATAPTLEAYAKISAPIAKDAPYKGMYRTLVKSAHSPASANEFSLPVPLGSRNGGALVRGIHFFHTNITKLQIVKDGFYLLQEGANALVQFEENENYRTTQSGLISWDPLTDDFEPLAVPTLRPDGSPANFEVKATVSAADNITVYSDLLQTFDRM